MEEVARKEVDVLNTSLNLVQSDREKMIIINKRFSQTIKFDIDDNEEVENRTQNLSQKDFPDIDRNTSNNVNDTGFNGVHSKVYENQIKIQIDNWNKSKLNSNFEKAQLDTCYATNLVNYNTNLENCDYETSSVNNYYTNHVKKSEKKLQSYKNFNLETLDKFKKKLDTKKYRTINIEIKPKEEKSSEESKLGSNVEDNQKDFEIESFLKLAKSREIIRKTPAYLYSRNQTKNEVNLNECQKDQEVEIDPDDPYAFFEFKNNFSNKISKFILTQNQENFYKKKNHFLGRTSGVVIESNSEEEISLPEKSELQARGVENIEGIDAIESNTRGGIVVFNRNLKTTPIHHLDINDQKEMTLLHITFRKIEDSVKSIQNAWYIYKINKTFSSIKIQSAWRAYKLRQKFSPILYYFCILQNRIILLQNLIDKKEKKIAFFKIFFLDKYDLYSDSLDKLKCLVLLKRSYKKFLPLKILKKPLINEKNDLITKENKVHLRRFVFEKLNSEKNLYLFSKINKNDYDNLKVVTIQRYWRDSFTKNKTIHVEEFEIIKSKKQAVIIEKKLIKALLFTKECKTTIFKFPNFKLPSSTNFFSKNIIEKHTLLNIKKIKNQWNIISPILKQQFNKRNYPEHLSLRKLKLNHNHCYLTKTADNTNCSIKKIKEIQKIIKPKLLNNLYPLRRQLLPIGANPINNLKNKLESIRLMTAFLAKSFCRDTYSELIEFQQDSKCRQRLSSLLKRKQMQIILNKDTLLEVKRRLMCIDFIFTLDYKLRNHSGRFVLKSLISFSEFHKKKLFFDSLYYMMYENYLNLIQPFVNRDEDFSYLDNENCYEVDLYSEKDIYMKNNAKRKWYLDSDMIKVDLNESQQKEKIQTKNGNEDRVNLKNQEDRKLEFVLDALRKNNRLGSKNSSQVLLDMINQE